MVASPKINLLYFKAVLDAVFVRFFDLYNNSFTNIDGNYYLKEEVPYSRLVKIFRELAVDELKKHINKFNILSPHYYVIIGACMPKDNILLKYKDSGYFPEKLDKLLKADYQLKYSLREKDIKLDMLKFNEVCVKVFNEFFSGKNKVERYFGKEYVRNLVFVQHKHLDCYSLFKMIKFMYGRTNCRNLYEERFKECMCPLIAVNDLIDRYVHNKTALNKDVDFKQYVEEVKRFLKASLGI